MSITLNPETIWVLKEDYSLKKSQISYIKKFIELYDGIAEEYTDTVALTCGDAYAEALNYNEYNAEDIAAGKVERMSIMKNMEKNLHRYYESIAKTVPKKNVKK